ncbi:acyloxyacyl hydrolase [Brumicola blandensis]|jgi:hypothetical protein|uniref:Lipid A deacylase n=1 Tax=Brumicola blandensis TaxID=3075611 RepID=A0AAW8R705_9ALTE|nr:acyloxyacyl hydrolase [Alteromonas sp. W409]MDT0583605.1 acyloxyacyl hydrolase [Alteromonas sp. W409]
MQTKGKTFIGQHLRNTVLSVSALIIAFSSSLAIAEQQNTNTQKASIEYMTGTSDMHGMRIAYRPDIKHTFDLPLIGETNLEWEASLNLFDIHGSAKNEATYGLSLSPVFLKSIPSFSERYPLAVEFGIGVAYVHEEKFGGVNIGSYYQFEDRIGLVMSINEEETAQVALRYIHYSNGGFNTKNPGLDFITLAYLHSF